MNDLRHGLIGQIDLQVGIGRFLVRVIDPSEASDLPIARLGVDALTVRLLAVGERGSDVDEEEGSARGTSGRGNDVPCGLSRARVRRGRGGDDGGTGSGQLGLKEEPNEKKKRKKKTRQDKNRP